MRQRLLLLAFLLTLVLAVTPGFHSLYGQIPAPRTVPREDINSDLTRFTTLLEMVEDNYATNVNSEKAVQGAIDGALRTLDPHSHYSDPKAFAQMVEDQRGRYYGLGITVTTRFGKVTVISRPFKGSPAERAD